MAVASRVTIVFVSKRNSLRSVLAQACLQHLGKERFEVLSCGRPGHVADEIHPATFGALAGASIKVPLIEPTSWARFKARELSKASFIITLDAETHAAGPSWPGQPDSALWVMPDVAAIDNDEKVAYGAIQTLYALRRRVELFINLPMATAHRATLRDDIRDLGRMH